MFSDHHTHPQNHSGYHQHHSNNHPHDDLQTITIVITIIIVKLLPNYHKTITKLLQNYDQTITIIIVKLERVDGGGGGCI